jgi:hypothetical protein
LPGEEEMIETEKRRNRRSAAMQMLAKCPSLPRIAPCLALIPGAVSSVNK